MLAFRWSSSCNWLNWFTYSSCFGTAGKRTVNNYCKQFLEHKCNVSTSELTNKVDLNNIKQNYVQKLCSRKWRLTNVDGAVLSCKTKGVILQERIWMKIPEITPLPVLPLTTLSKLMLLSILSLSVKQNFPSSTFLKVN